MTQLATRDIGWLPMRFDVVVGNLSVTTLPEFEEVVNRVKAGKGVEKDWIYAPPQRQHSMGNGIRTLPYPSRVFGLPMTHRISHSSADGDAHMAFLVWALSFIFGMRLTATEAGFLDATPIRIGKLNDFVLGGLEYKHAFALAEQFWQTHQADASRAKLWGAAVHALMLGQGPLALQFERFLYLYGALDACFKLTQTIFGAGGPRIPHAERIAWMCHKFGMTVPVWADSTAGQPLVANLRNSAVHESLFMDAPLGFALHGVGSNENLPLEMEAVICRLLVALLGDPTNSYVTSVVTTRQQHGWSPPA